MQAFAPYPSDLHFLLRAVSHVCNAAVATAQHDWYFTRLAGFSKPTYPCSEAQMCWQQREHALQEEQDGVNSLKGS
jgi:hypothetical protein